MSLKRRNFIAWVLLLAAAVCWVFGQQMLSKDGESVGFATTNPGIYHNTTMETLAPMTTAATVPAGERIQSISTAPTIGRGYEEVMPDNDPNSRNLGFLLSFGAVILACAAVFGLRQKAPILGPDGISAGTAFLSLAHLALSNWEHILWGMGFELLMLSTNIMAVFVILFAARELWGWLRARFSLAWCLVHRISQLCPTPQLSLIVFVGWIMAALAGSGCLLFKYSFYYAVVPVSCFAAAAFLGVLCLWMYGADLNHFKTQLNNYQQGLPITVKEGAFAQTEAQLLDVQAQHEEAVRTAVTSERFKVELISNVSHDLRTPLTAILGYSELLQKQSLSPEGQEQLRRLHQKAGYMNDLVESLFELTKVSSGVSQSKKEEIDLVRLLEQTIGLFDDQLVDAGLVVRRNYGSDSIPMVTDGARMHQVFANLLSNAIKYALPGTRIYLEVRETESSFLVRMMNTASYEMDFKPEEIMQRFARGDKARSTKGSGLGLAIAQTYTESVGGSFRVGVDGDQFSAIVELPKL